MTLRVSRRSLLALGAGLGSTAMLGETALSKAPQLGTQVPAFYRFKVGDAEVSVISDGALTLGDPKGTFTGVPEEELRKMLSDNFLPPNAVMLEQNSPVVNFGNKLVLFDTGLGTVKGFGPSTGRQQRSLKAAGIKPEDVDAVVFSHAHPDHVGGVIGANGKPLFPNAQFYIAQSDLDFWTDEGKLNGPLKDFIGVARKNLLPVRNRIVFYKDGQEFLPGIQAMAAPGHTVGHTVYLITSQGKTLCNAGDIAHHHTMVVENPQRAFVFDTDGQQAVESRLRVFDMLASQRVAAVTYHFPWPGLGHIGKQGERFHYFPTPLRTVL